MAGSLAAGTAADAHLIRGVGSDDPETVLRAYVQAALSTPDPAAAVALTCRRPHLAGIKQWQHQLAVSRQRFALPPLVVQVRSYRDVRTGGRVTADAAVEVTLAVNGQLQERVTRPYTFTLVREHGWKVCLAQTRE